MNVVSLCSGAGGLDHGLEQAGMTIVAHCEIDPHARSVLARHWPGVPCHDDITTMNGDDYRGRADLVAGGTPCTDLSVAGRRAGLAGDESRLFWDFCRVADQSAADWVLWENVAGALSSNGGADFAAVLWGLTGYRPAVPEDGWRTIGLCQGSRRAAAWRVLDARWFGVAQRRRRVFVVAGPRAGRPLEVLAEPESSGRNPRPVRAQGAPAAAGTLTGPPRGRGGYRTGVDEAQAGLLVPYVKSRRAHHDEDDESWVTADVAPTLNAFENHNDERATVAVPIAFDANYSGMWPVPENEITTAAVTAAPGSQPAVAYPITQHSRGIEVGSEPDLYHALRAGDGSSSRNPGVLIDGGRWVGGVQQDEILTVDGVTGTLAHSSNHHTGHHEPKVLLPNMAVRRLTPRECERLMGWPDDWTRWTADGTEIADSHRYRMCGNGVVSNVATWIGRRLP